MGQKAKTEENHQTFEPCACCGFVTENGNCFHHLLSRKSHPEYTWSPWNRIPVDQLHHNQFHNKGTAWMAGKFEGVRKFLERNGWELCELSKKWIHPKEQGC